MHSLSSHNVVLKTQQQQDSSWIVIAKEGQNRD